MRTIRYILELWKKFPLLLSFGTFLWALVGIFEAAAIFSIAPVVDMILHPGLEQASPITRTMVDWVETAGLPVSLLTMLLVFLAFSLLKAIFQVSAYNLVLRTKYAVHRELMMGTFDDFFNARWYFFSSGKQGAFINTFIRELGMVGDAFFHMGILFSSFLLLALYLAVPFYISWKITLLCMCIALILGAPFLLVGRFSYRLGQINTATSNAMGGVLLESLSAAKLVLGFGNQAKNAASLASAFDKHRVATVKSQTLNMSLPILYYPLGIMVMVLAVISSKRLGVPLAESAALLYSLVRIVPVIGQMVANKTVLDNFFPSYEQVQAFRK
ncbi:ABC transporter transmembrane domain-containing protein, partial [Elusimicrobiota bacterium]